MFTSHKLALVRGEQKSCVILTKLKARIAVSSIKYLNFSNVWQDILDMIPCGFKSLTALIYKDL